MNCQCCEEEIGETPMIQTTCCENTCHTACYFERIQHTYDDVCCGLCEATLVTRTYAQEPEPTESPELTAAVALLKKAHAEMNKAGRALTSVVTQEHRAFKAAAAPMLEALTTLKREAFTTIKQTPEYRDCAKFGRKRSALINHIRKTFHVRWWFFRQQGLRVYRRTTMDTLQRKFRIRL